MRSFLLFGLYFLFLQKEVLAENEYEIKQGVYPFIAILYYPDEINLRPPDNRFVRSAVLIKPEWLVSSSMETNDTQISFPLKTLLARAGAVRIDANFTLNEDENEQEREVIKIVRPTNFSHNPWWYNDITVLKTLLPFNITTAVTWTTPTVKHDIMDKTCSILVYTKRYKNSSDENVLMQLPVELLPSSGDSCGIYFRKETMICAIDDGNKISVDNPEFCRNNAGGPLMCDGDIIGIQTYINNECKQPYLYQSLSVWDDFITCSVEEKYRTQEYANICEVIDKDSIDSTAKHVNVSMMIPKATKEINIDRFSEDISDEEHAFEATKVLNTTVTENEKPTPTAPLKEELTTPTDLTSVAITEELDKSTRITASETSWPRQQLVEHRKMLDENDDSNKIERNTNVEAQRHEVKKKGRNGVENPIMGIACLFYSLAFGVLFITYYI